MVNDLYSYSQSVDVQMDTLLLNLTNQITESMNDFDIDLKKSTFEFLKAARKDITITSNISVIDSFSSDWTPISKFLVYFNFLTKEVVYRGITKR